MRAIATRTVMQKVASNGIKTMIKNNSNENSDDKIKTKNVKKLQANQQG